MHRPSLHRLLTLAGLTVAAPALVLGLSSAPAGAAITGLSVSNTAPSDDDLITVSGFVSPGATVSIAECNTDVPVAGTDCNRTATDRFARVTAHATTGAFSVQIVVDDEFTNASFIPGVSPSTPDTDCDSTAGSEQCSIVVVEYAANVPVDTEIVDLTFI